MEIIKRKVSLTVLDMIILLLAFSLAAALIPYRSAGNFQASDAGLSAFVILWLGVSYLSKKLDAARFLSLRNLYMRLFVTNLIVGLFSALVMIGFQTPQYFLFVVLVTIAAATFLEILLGSFYFSLKHAKMLQEDISLSQNSSLMVNPYLQVPDKPPISIERKRIPSTRHEPDLLGEQEDAPVEERIDHLLMKEAGAAVYQFINSRIDLSNGNHIVFSTITPFNIERLPKYHYTSLVNLRRINDIRYINKFFEAVNAKIPKNGMFIGCAETQELRKVRLLRKYPPGINLLYYTLDFILKRVFPKFNLTKKIYFYLTRGNNRVISRAEVLGRLYCCGFEIIEEKLLDGYYYFAARKEKEPTYDLHPTYGPFIKLGRTGKDGKIIKVYKIRTMHPYSEYLQEYVYTNHYLKEGGKFNNDFRISTLGKIFRKFWIDEIPMIFNILNGEMKLVGVRPLSIHYFNLYTEELQKKRIQVKPGLIPPFYADLPKTLEEIMESEMRYLDDYQKHPIRTDFKYFFLAFYNIIFRNSRSN